MKFFIDTANLDEIAEAKSWGCLAGVTTNPSLYAKTGGKLADFEPHMLKIAELCAGLPVSAESTAPTVEGMVEEGRRLSALAPNIVVKLPVTESGLAACRALANQGVRVNMTLVFSATQALLAANAGARYISPFVGRYDDIALTASRSSGTWYCASRTMTGPIRTSTARWRSSPPRFARRSTSRRPRSWDAISRRFP